MDWNRIGTNVPVDGLKARLSRLAEIGFKYVYFDGSIWKLSEEALADVADFCRALGIEPFSAHGAGAFLPREESAMEEHVAALKAQIQAAKVLGLKCITFHAATVEGIGAFETKPYIERVGWDRFLELNARVLRELAREAARVGVVVTIENLPPRCVGDACRTVQNLKRFLEACGQTNVGICLDTGHANICGLCSWKMVLEAGSSLAETHFNDNFGWLTDENPKNDLHRPPGIGTIDWLRVLAALERIEYEQPVMFELGIKGEEDWAIQAQQTLANWKQLLHVRDFLGETFSQILALET